MSLLGRLHCGQGAGQSLCDDAVDRRREHERLDAHVDQPRDCAGGVARVQRGHHEVPSEGCLDRDLSGLRITNLADHDHVRVGTKHRAQAVGEGNTGLDRHLHLLDARDRGLDRILDREDAALAVVDDAERAVERRRLPGARGSGYKDGAIGLSDRRQEPLVLRVLHAQRAEVAHHRAGVEDPHHDPFASRSAATSPRARRCGARQSSPPDGRPAGPGARRYPGWP